MIRSFRCKKTHSLFQDEPVAAFRAFERIGRRKLYMLNEAQTLGELAIIPGNRLEQLQGKRQGEHSIRINDQWRLTFQWGPDGPYDVAIEDYH